MDRFDVVKEIGQGNFGTAKLLRDKRTNELFAVKYIDRGPKVLRRNNLVVASRVSGDDADNLHNHYLLLHSDNHQHHSSPSSG